MNVHLAVVFTIAAAVLFVECRTDVVVIVRGMRDLSNNVRARSLIGLPDATENLRGSEKSVRRHPQASSPPDDLEAFLDSWVEPKVENNSPSRKKQQRNRYQQTELTPADRLLDQPMTSLRSRSTSTMHNDDQRMVATVILTSVLVLCTFGIAFFTVFILHFNCKNRLS